MTLLKSLLVAGAVALCVQSASASTILNFTNNLAPVNAATSNAMSFSGPGLEVGVQAGQFVSFDGDDLPSPRQATANTLDLVTQSTRGLGEMHYIDGEFTDPMKSVDSGGTAPNTWREALVFSFSQAVRILNVTFFVPNAQASGFVFTGPTASALSALQVPNGFTITGTGTQSGSFASYVGQYFAFGARAGTNNFYITSMEVEVVPLPAGGLLLVSALAVPFLRRKRRAA